MLDSIIENSLINSLAGKFCRSPFQLNLLHRSDSELLIFPDSSMAVTIDSISEEISAGLYDPYLAGWMSVMVNFSDIAASGADPVGILISEIFPDGYPESCINEIQAGINDAVIKCGSFVLGGDTNSGGSLVLTGCALGRSPDNKYLQRTGCRSSEGVYATGKAGRGNAFALGKLLGREVPLLQYFPTARLKEASILRHHASCCIDTSDGFLAALDQLMRINDCGFILTDNWENLIDAESAGLARVGNIPEWLLLAGQHGEYELIFTIPEDNEKKFLESAFLSGWEPLKIGVVTADPVIRMNLYNRITVIDTKLLRNIPFETKGNVQNYLKKLLEYDFRLK